jgi:holliday junction DNA helicase RuvA
MIASLRGELAQTGETSVVIDVAGVGFEVVVPASTLAALPDPGEVVSLIILTSVRDDSIVLYGFASPEERDLFVALKSVGQIGPKVAITICGAVTPPEFWQAIGLADTRWLSRLPQVGKKTAERMILELKDKAPALSSLPDSAVEVVRPAAAVSIRNDLADALQGLGFRQTEINAVLRTVRPKDGDALDELLRRALAALTPKNR